MVTAAGGDGVNELLVLSASDVETCLPMDEAITAMQSALVSVSAGDVHNPLRTIIAPPVEGAPGLLGLMPAVRGGAEWLYGLKEVCVFPGNHHHGVDSHQGSVLLHEGETGRLVALLNGSAVTAIRTAATTAVASRLLAREESSTLALVGAGIQARWHLEALALVHDFVDIRVCASRPERAEQFAAEWSSKYPVRAVETVAQAVGGADIVTTVTSSAEPIVQRGWIDAGTHINAIGSSVKNRRELDTETVAAARLFVDRRESTLNEAGDYLLAIAEDRSLGPHHIAAEVGEVLAGNSNGRTSAEEITLFKSLGLAIEDLAAGEVAVKNARRLGHGVLVPFG